MSSNKSKKQPKKNNSFLGAHNSNNLKAANSELISGIVRWSFCIIGTILLFACLAFLITKIYHPETESIVQAALEKCLFTDFQPEPVEALLYRTGLLFIPCCLLLLYYISTRPFFQKIAQNKALAYILVILATIGIALLTYYVFAQDNPTFKDTLGKELNERDRTAETNFQFFFLNSYLYSHLTLYLCAWVTLLLLFYLIVTRFLKDKWLKAYNILISIAGFVYSGIMILQLFGMNHFSMPLNWENQYDFNAVYYSVTQVNAGSQLLADGFTNTYGLYPHFLQPIFSVFGLSVSNFTWMMSLLIAFTFASLLLLLYTNVKDKLLVFLGFSSAVFFPYLLNRLVTNFDAAFATFPIRTTPMAFLILFISLYLIVNQKKSTSTEDKPAQRPIATRVVYYLGMFLLPFGILWNFEYGGVSFITWIAFLCYNDFYDADLKIHWKKILLHIGVAILALLFDFLLYGIIQYIQYGHFPDFPLLISTLTVFSKMGYFLLPMSVFHPWMLVVLVYMFGLTYAIAALYRKNITRKSSVIFAIAILGCGLFAYYQGRSHNWNMTVSFVLSFTELVLLTDELLVSYRNTKHIALIPFLYLSLACLFFSIISLGAASSDISKLANQTVSKELKQSYANEKKYINKVNHFIDSCDIASDRVILLSSNKYQGLFMQNKRMRSAVNPGILDMFYKTDAERYVTTIVDSTYDVFLGHNFYYSHLANIRTALAMEYQVVDRLYDTTALIFAHLQKRNVPAPTTVFFPERKTTLLHEKFIKDSTYYRQLGKLSQNGKDSLDIPSTFSVEILFRADSLQFYQFPVLCANNTDSTGFAIFISGNKEKPDEYYINLGGIGFPIQLKPNQWHYLTVVYSGQQVFAYDNGQLKAAVMFPSAYRPSTSHLYVGNNGSLRYFSGIINEVALSSGALSASDISNTWQNINSWIQKQPTISK